MSAADARPETAPDLPLVSVVVSVQNRPELIVRLLEALQTQTYPAERYEVVVVDNGSTDETPSVVRAFGEEARMAVRVVSKEPSSVSASRNLGVDEARGDVIAFTDSDCRPTPGWLAEGVRGLAGADLVQGLTVADPAMYRGPQHRTVEAGGDVGLFDTCNMFFRTAAFREAGGFDPRFTRRIRLPRPRSRHEYGFGEDTEMAWRLIRRGHAVTYRPQALVHHHVFAPDIREMVVRTWLVGGFPSLVREIPELRRRFLTNGLFLSPDRPYVWAGLAGLWLLARRRPVLGALGVGAYVWRRVSAGPGSRRERVRSLPALALLDAVATAGLVVGSIRARRLVL
jgi:glycosyltransferase involved in cell wall biosynthesis